MSLQLISGRSRKAEGVLALLDLGTSHVSCLILSVPEGAGKDARVGAPLPVRKLGYGVTRSRGIRAGTVVDLAEAEQAVNAAVSQAEAEADARVEEVVVAVTSGRIQALTFATSAKPSEGVVGTADIEKMLAAGRGFAERDGRKLLHLHRLGFRLDKQTGILNPRGMTGNRLSLDLNAVTSDEANLRNIRNLLARSYLSAISFIAASYASALATLGEEDLQGITLVVDLGAGTSTYAIFRDGLFVDTGALALGGLQVTLDVARALAIPVNQAERIKALYGNLVGAMSDEHEFVPLTLGGNSTAAEQRLTRAQLRQIVRPKCEDVLRLLRERVATGNLAQQRPQRLILTGGASQLAGMSEMAGHYFGCPVRVGWPHAVAGLGASASTPSGSALVGLAYATLVPGAIGRLAEPAMATPRSYAGQLKRWFKESFWDDEQPPDAERA